MAATLSSLNIAQAGSSPVAMFEQTWTINGNPKTVYIQASSLVDSVTGLAATIDANGLHVVPSFGTPNASGPISLTAGSAIAPGASGTLTSTVPVTNGKTGTLQHAIFASTQPTLWTIQTVNNAGTPTSVTSFITGANETFDFKPGTSGEIATVASTSTSCKFQATAQNIGTDQNNPDSVYVSFFWAEN